MLPQKCKYFLSRLIDMGPRTALWLAWHRLKKQHFIAAWRPYRTSNLGRIFRARRHKQLISESTFAGCFNTDFIDRIRADHQFIATMPSDYTNSQQLMTQADAITNDMVSILGHGAQRLSSWHTDTTHPHPSPHSWRNAFYIDITIPLHTSADSCGPDIKIPWEFSRLQHLVTLGYAYQHAIATHDMRAEKYCQTFVRHINDWITNNPFLYGVNWTNPMEVSIRSINLIWACHLFKKAPVCTEEFWKLYVNVLHNHAIYLEHNWEVSDKPNNHYLADLVGAFYLHVFFNSLPGYHRTSQRTLQKIVSAFTQQLHPDDTSYEGSTSYHALDTELLLHTIMLARHTGLVVPPYMLTWYRHMTQFLTDCSDHKGNFIRCGDDDGGRIVFGIKPLARSWFDTPSLDARALTTNGFMPPSRLRDKMYRRIAHYPNFGLSIIKANSLHFSFRHPTYNHRQPTGHFHQDHLAITLSIAGTPLFVDPGTYVYTASTSWRNYFRSWEAHNTFFCENCIPPANTNLFAQTRRPHPAAAPPAVSNGIITLHNYHDEWAAQGLRLQRSISMDTNKQELIITDTCLQYGEIKNDTQIGWAFHLAPEIAGESHDQKTWIFSKQGKLVAILTSTCALEWQPDAVAPTYGCKVASHTLVGKNIPPGTQQFIIRSHR